MVEGWQRRVWLIQGRGVNFTSAARDVLPTEALGPNHCTIHLAIHFLFSGSFFYFLVLLTKYYMFFYCIPRHKDLIMSYHFKFPTVPRQGLILLLLFNMFFLLCDTAMLSVLLTTFFCTWNCPSKYCFFAICLNALSFSKYRQYPNCTWNFSKSYLMYWFWNSVKIKCTIYWLYY